jgi:LmbE family N-acetylglucosaminyl deacetylase
MKRMILVFSHPDDESFFCGLTAAKYAKAGWDIHLVVLTNGEKGQSGQFDLPQGKGLGVVRKTELEQAAKILGITTISAFDYPDGKLTEINSGELEDKLYQKMVEVSPEAVITFDPTGISNHPDHIKTCFASTYAFQKYTKHLEDTREFIEKVENKEFVKSRLFISRHKFALKQKNFAEVIETSTEPKLYYVCMPESVTAYLKKEYVIPEESFDKPRVGTPDKFITTVIEGKKFKNIKIKALEAHATQIADVEMFLSLPTHPGLSHEYFILRMQGTTEVFMGKSDKVRDRL